MSPELAIPTCIGCALALAGGVADVATCRIPNWLTYPGIASGFAFHVFSAQGVGAYAVALSVLGVGTVMCSLFRHRLVGGGDLKLAAGVAAWFSGMLVVQWAVATMAAAVGLALTWLSYGLIAHWAASSSASSSAPTWRSALAEARQVRVPLGVAIAIGSVVALGGVGV